MIHYKEDNLAEFNDLFDGRFEDFKFIIDNNPISDNYIPSRDNMLCSYITESDMPTWTDRRILEGFKTFNFIRDDIDRTFYNIDSFWSIIMGLHLNPDISEENKKLAKSLSEILKSNILIKELYHRPSLTRYNFELRIVNQLLPTEMYEEINILFKDKCMLPIRSAEIDGKMHYCFFKTAGDNYGVTDGLGYIGIFYIFSDNKDFIRKSLTECILYELLTDNEHRLPKEVNDEFISKISNLDFNIDELKLEKLKNIVKKSFDNIIKMSSKRIEDYTRFAKDYLDRYRTTITSMDSENERLQLLINKSDKTIKEFLDIILKYKSKNIILDISDKNVIGAKNNKINIMLRTPLFNFNEDILNKILKDPGKYLLSEDMFVYKLFKNTLTEDCKYEIVFTTPIAIDLSENNILVDGLRITSTSSREIAISTAKCMNGIPNPHLAFFNCWGQNGPELVKLLNKSKYEEFFIALIATAGNLNLSDVTVVERFKNMLNNIGATNNIIKFIRNKETNKLLSKVEFLKEIKSDEND